MSDTNGPDDISVDIADEGPCQKRMTIEVPAETIQKEIDQNYDNLRQNIDLPGFRRGKVPRSLLEKRFGEKIEEDVREELIHSTFTDEVEKAELRMVGRPTFDNVHFQVGDSLRFESKFEVAPDFEVENYKGLDVEARTIDVSEKTVDQELDGLRQQCASHDEVPSGEQQEEDIAVVDLVMKDGDEELIHREDIYLKIGQNQVDTIDVPGLGEKLVGAAYDDTLEFEVVIPENFPREDLQNRKVTLALGLKKALRKTLPEIDAAFLGRFGQETQDGLKAEIRQSLENRRRLEEELRQEEELVDRLAAQVEMQLPPTVVENRAKELRSALQFRLYREGKKPEEVEKLVEEDDSIAEEARNELQRIFLLDHIADKEQLFVTEDEVANRLGAIAATQNRAPEEVAEEYRESGMLEELRNGLLREKVRRFIRENASVQSPDMGVDDSADDSADDDAGDAEKNEE